MDYAVYDDMLNIAILYKLPHWSNTLIQFGCNCFIGSKEAQDRSRQHNYYKDRQYKGTGRVFDCILATYPYY